jgi:hypothetical protein
MISPETKRENQAYARNFNLARFKPILEQCREGNFDSINNGYHLWVHSLIVLQNGGSWDQLGSSREEMEGFLVDDLKKRISEAKNETSSSHKAWWDLTLTASYFMIEDSEDGTVIEPGIFDQLEISQEQFWELWHLLQIRTAKEELEKCRDEEPTDHFWGLKRNLLNGDTTLEEIGASQEEIENYTSLYLKKYPFSGWKDVSPEED